jgi:DNA-binding Lrp family transcriptional regulator
MLIDGRHPRVRLSNVPRVDATDARLLLALAEDPRATVSALAQQLGLARNTVQTRLARLESAGVLGPLDRRVRPEALGYPLGAYVTVHVVARDADDLWRITEQVLAIPGVQRTDTALSLRRFVEPRIAPLIERIARSAEA